MKTSDIRIRDPYILPFQNKYYMYGTGYPGADNIDENRQFWCYVSDDLKNWSEPILCFDAPSNFWGEKCFWAPEVHLYNGKFYMFATFYAEGKMRATQALVSDNPKGPFVVHSKPLTPEKWMCLDGTLYVEENVPYLVFCHEWLQAVDGEMAYVKLNDNLTEAIEESNVLFTASESGWADVIPQIDYPAYVTDGPWLWKDEETLIMFWSSFHKGSYAVGYAVSESGSIKGPWKHSQRLLFEKDGGHGMMFEGFDGKLHFVIHQPNYAPMERPRFYEIEKTDIGYILKK